MTHQSSKICPFTGLRSFSVEETLYFKGRDLHIKKALELLREKKFLVLTGASGDGKSSLVYAGLIPNAKAGFIKAQFTNWVIADFRPERQPLENMISTLTTQLQYDGVDAVKAELRLGYSALVDLYKNSSRYLDTNSKAWINADEKSRLKLQNNAANLLILVDQFEEFFTNPENYSKGKVSDDAKILVNLLIETNKIAISQDLPIFIVCTMRSDYIGHCASFRGLPELIGQAHYFVPRLNRNEISNVIEEPVLLSGNKISPRLVERLVNDLKEGPDILPVLQHALYQIWKVSAEENAESMDLIHYAKAGGMTEKALPEKDLKEYDEWFNELPAYKRKLLKNPSLENILNTHSNELYETAYEHYNKLPGNDGIITSGQAKKIIKTTFTCLTKFDENKAVRNRMSLREVTEMIGDDNIDSEKVAGVLKIFREPGNTLIRPFLTNINDPYDLKPDTVLDITHEALIRNWSRLAEWAKKENNTLEIYYDFHTQLKRWKNNNKSKEHLLPVGPLGFFETWFNEFDINVLSWLKRYMLVDKYDAEDFPDQSGIPESTDKQRKTKEVDPGKVINRIAEQHLKDIREFLNQSRKSINVKRNFARAAMALITVLLIIVAGAYFQAKKEKIISRSNELATLSFLNLPDDPTLSFRLAEKAYSINNKGLYAKKALLKAFYGTSILSKKLQNHLASVVEANYSSDGKYIVTASYDNTARVWNINEGKTIVLNHPNRVTYAVFSLDGKHIISACKDSIVRIWSDDGKMLHELENNSNRKDYFTDNKQISPDGKQFLILSDSSAVIWNLSGEKLQTLKHPVRIYSAEFSIQGNLIVTAALDNTVRLWGINGEMITVMERDNENLADLRNARFSDDGRHIVGTSYWSHTSHIWNLKGKLLHILKGHRHGIHDIDISPDNKHIVTVSYDRTARVWDFNGKELLVLKHPRPVDDGIFSPDGKLIATTSRDNSARIWDLKGNELQILRHPDYVSSVDFSPDGKYLLTSCRDKIARIWNVNKKHLPVLRGHSNTITEAKFFSDDEQIISSSVDSTIRIWDREGKEIKKIKFAHPINNAVILSGNKQIALTTGDNIVKICDMNGNEKFRLTKHNQVVNAVACSRDGEFLVTGSKDSTAIVWDKEGKETLKLIGHKGSVTSVSFSPDMKFILTSSTDSTAILWDWNGKLLYVLNGHDGGILYSNFSQDSKYIITSSEDRLVKLWDIKGRNILTLSGNEYPVKMANISPNNKFIVVTNGNSFSLFDIDGNELIEIERHFDEITSVHFSSDENYIISASKDRTIRIWPILPELILRMVNDEKVMGTVRGLSEGEKIEYGINN